MDSQSALPADASAGARRIELRELFSIADWQGELTWTPFRDGVDIYRLYGDGVSGPSAMLIRFRPGGIVPLHEHLGFEHIVVLSGEQRDCTALSTVGTLIVNPPGSRHRIISEKGCIVLAIYEKPVKFLSETSG